MRAWVLLAALLLLPTAAAATAKLTLTVPGDLVDSGSSVPVDITLVADGFWCAQARDFLVHLTARGSSAQATIYNSTIRFPATEDPYFAHEYRTNGTLPVMVEALDETEGVVDVVASVSPPSDCYTSDPWQVASANVTIRVRPAPAESESPPPETNETNETMETPPPEANETPSENATEESLGGERRPPSEGYIGDYRPPEESRDAPGVGLALLVAVAAAVALARKR